MTPKRAIALLGERKVMTLGELVTRVVGGPVKGSWWGHPKGKVIFNAGSALGEAPDTLVLKLVDGKVTFVHRELWPAVYRVVTDGERWAACSRRLTAPAKKLLAEVEAAGEVRAPPPKPREELEKRLLVHAEEVHTERGSHEKVLRSWERWAVRAPDVPRAARALSVEQAFERLSAALGRALALPR